MIDMGLRLPPRLLADLTQLAASLGMERAQLMRILLADGVARSKSSWAVKAATAGK